MNILKTCKFVVVKGEEKTGVEDFFKIAKLLKVEGSYLILKHISKKLRKINRK